MRGRREDLSVHTFLISFPPNFPRVFPLTGTNAQNKWKKQLKKQNMKQGAALEINLFLFIYCFSILKRRERKKEKNYVPECARKR